MRHRHIVRCMDRHAASDPPPGARLTPDTASVLEALEHDGGEDVAIAFARLAAGYIAQTRSGAGPVSTAHSATDLAARFDEPLPATGRDALEVLSRVERDVLPDCNRLLHPRAMGHQV